MSYTSVSGPGAAGSAIRCAGPATGFGATFWRTKRSFDIVVSLLAIPALAVLALALALANPLFNRGPLLFRQTRMGRDGRPFEIYKFRTMRPAATTHRGPADPVEWTRITPLGRWLRRLRLDEVPQVLNVLRGDMSLIGPRPDFIDHAHDYMQTVPSYGARHAVRPGISGYAQVCLGYAEGHDLTAEKTRLDLFYIENVGWRLDLWILLRTVGVMLTGKGSR